MDKKFEAEKKELERERAKLVAEISKAEIPEDFGGDVDDLDEEKNEAESLGNQLALAQTLKERLNDIDHALAKIASGTYGICEKCGGPIEAEVLKASPESRFCKACKKGE